MLLLRKIFAWLAPYDCLKCGREGSLLCAGCLLAAVPRPVVQRPPPPPLRRLWVAADYQAAIRHLLHVYKFDRARDLSALLGEVLDRASPSLPPGTIITYVPTATSRIRERGYDHAKELAKAFAARRGLVAQSTLIRIGQSRQMGADRAQRMRQRNTYAIRAKANIVGTRIILVDDIITTGATLQSAATVLLAAGAREINGLAVAQKE